MVRFLQGLGLGRELAAGLVAIRVVTPSLKPWCFLALLACS